MPRRPRFQGLETDVEIPWLLRLGQFLSNAGDAVGDYGDTRARDFTQSRGLLDDLLTQENRQTTQGFTLAQLLRQQKKDEADAAHQSTMEGFKRSEVQMAQDKARREAEAAASDEEALRSLFGAPHKTTIADEGTFSSTGVPPGVVGMTPTPMDRPGVLEAGAKGLPMPGAPAGGDLLSRAEQMGRAGGRIPKTFLDALIKRDLEQGKPEAGFTLGEGQIRYDAAGKPIAGTAKPPKSFWEGKTTTELEGYLTDPATPADLKGQIETALKRIEARDLTKARETGLRGQEAATARALGPQPITAEAAQRGAEAERTVTLANQAMATFQAHPDWVGGPFGATGKARGLQARLGTAPEGYTEFKAQVQEMVGTFARRVAGAALTPTEEARYLAYLPDLLSDSSQEFAAKLRLMPQRSIELEAAIERRRLGTSAPPAAPPVAPPSAAQALEELRRRGVVP